MFDSRSKDVVTCFLSCSVRPNDRALVDAVQSRVLEPMGFRCFTVGRNLSLPAQPDDGIKQLMNSCKCLVGVATERLEARERDAPDRTLSLATPYLLQETSMAFQSNMPFLILRSDGVDLQGVTRKHLWLTIRPELRNGRVVFADRPQAVYAALQELKRLALARRAALSTSEWKQRAGWLSAITLGAMGAARGVQLLLRPSCFGDFYYLDSQCKECSYKRECKAEKQLRNR